MLNNLDNLFESTNHAAEAPMLDELDSLLDILDDDDEIPYSEEYTFFSEIVDALDHVRAVCSDDPWQYICGFSHEMFQTHGWWGYGGEWNEYDPAFINKWCREAFLCMVTKAWIVTQAYEML